LLRKLLLRQQHRTAPATKDVMLLHSPRWEMHINNLHQGVSPTPFFLLQIFVNYFEQGINYAYP
ncbi:MAG TPA: hypothetical protein DHW15_01570, partial [Bacteroidetes bacterium]|nr:hypothetical protein [Bacteroidota bacterium]